MSALPPDPTGLAALLGDPEVRKMMGDLVGKKLRADLAAIRGGAELLGRWRMDGDGPPRGGPDAAAPAGEGVIKELVRLHLEYYTALVDLTSEFNERTRVLLGGEPAAQARETPGADPEMRLSAPPGSTVRGAFRVENTTSDPMTVELVASPFARDGSDQITEPAVAFDPPRVELKPGQEARVTTLIPVGAELVPGATYRATISAAGVDTVRIAVRLDVEEPAEATAPGAQEPARTGTRAAPKKPAAPKRPAAAKKRPASTKTPKKAPATKKAPAATPRRRTARPTARPGRGE